MNKSIDQILTSFLAETRVTVELTESEILYWELVFLMPNDSETTLDESLLDASCVF